MNNYKRILSLILALILTLSPFTSAFAQTKTNVEKTRTEAQEIQIGDKVYYIFSKDKNAKSDLIKSQEKTEEKTEEIQTSDGLDLSGNLFGEPVGAGERIPYTLKIKGDNFIGVGGNTFDWDTLPEGFEIQVWYMDDSYQDVNVGNPIEINSTNYKNVITRTFEISGQPLAFGIKTNIDTETYLTNAYLENEKALEGVPGSLNVTFDLIQVPSTNLSVKWVDVNNQELESKDRPTTILKDILTFNFIEGKKFDLPNQDKEDSYFSLINKIDRRDIKDMEGATALVDGKKDGEEVTLDGKIYKLTTSYDPALNKGSKIQLMYMPDVIDRTKNPESPTPDKYVRVTIDAGEGTKLAEGETKKVYDVRIGKALKAEHYPKLEISDSAKYKEPITWTIAPGTAITKTEDIVGNAAKTAAETITAANLKAVDTTALQGQDLTEAFWHKGVALADNTPADKKEAFEALLAEATVTDKSSRNADTAGTFEGTLLVTFKDGSTLEVPKQKLIVKPNTIEVSFDNEANDDANAPRHKETVVKGKVTSTSDYPVKGAKVEIKDEAGKVIGITLADENGNFTAGTRELKAGEKLTASVTLPDSKLAAESTPKIVKLNPDRLNELLPIAKAQKENFSKKQNAIIKERLADLEKAINTADPLVDANGKAIATDTAENQTAIDNAVKALEDALKALTANIPPSISGPKTHEIFVGEDLDLKALVEVTDGDGAEDLVVENGSNVKITAAKVGGQTETPVADLSTINTTVGTYKVTYTAKDKSNAEVTHEMTLTVNPRTTSAIEVTTDPTNMSYLITEKGGKAKLNLDGMTLNLVDNLGKKTPVELTDPKVKLKLNGREVTNGADLTLADDVKFIEVEYTPEGSQTPLTAKTDGVLRVGPDYDKDGKDDRTQNFDPDKIEKLEVIKQPQLDYIAKDKSEADKVFKLNLEGMIVRMTDKAGKEKLAIVKQGKFYDYDEQTKEITQLTATPAHGATLTPETSATETGDNGKTVKITGPNNSEALTEPLKVFYDANGDGTPDHNEKTPAPSAMARNVGENPQGTTVEGMATPGAVIKITDKGGTVLTTEPTEVKAGPDGKYTATLKPILADGTDIKVTAKLGEMGESDPTPTTVFDDKNDNKQPDRDEGFNIEKATDIKFVDQPDLTYLVPTKDTEVTFDGKDGKGKAIYLELSYKNGDKTESKIMTLEDLMKDTDHISVTPAKGTTDKIGNDPANLVGKAIDVKLVKVDPATATSKATSESKFAIKVDANNNGIADEEETTDTPTVTARNIGTEGPDGKRVPATKTTVEIETVPKAKVTIEYTDKDGQPQKIENLTAGEDGKLTQEITPKLKEGTDVKVTVQDGEKKPTDKTVKVFDDLDDNKIPDNQAGQTERPAAIASNKGKNPTFTTITGEAEKGATVTAKVGTEVVGTATADSTTGKYTIQAKQNNAPIKEGVKIDVTATLAPKTESLKQTVVVFNDTDGTGQPDSSKDFDVKKATGMQVVASPDKMVYSDGDKLNLDGLKVLLTDVNGNQKIFTYNNANNDEFTKAGLSVDYKQGVKLTNDENGKKLTVTLDTTGNTHATEAITGETPTALTVNKNQSAQPTDVVAANQGDNEVTKVKGKATKDAEIKITDANGKNLLPEGKTIKADANGDFTADLNKLLDPGTKVFVTATEPGKSESPKAETPVIRDKDGDWEADTGSKLSTPVIDPVREKDEKVVVEAPKAEDKIQTIEVSDEKGNTVKLTKDPADTTGKTWKVEGTNDTVKENIDGKLEIPVKGTLPLNDRELIKVTFKDGEKPANEAFDKALVQKASQTPIVDPVYTGDKNVKIVDPTVADPTAKTIKVKVGDNDSMTVEKQADGSWKVKEDPNKEVKVEDGKIVVPLDPSAKKGEVIKVSTINDSGKASPAAEVTVVDKEKSTTPEVNPVATNDTKITGTAGPNADVVITITPKDGGTPKEIVTKADKDGNFTVPADGLKDGDTIVAKATEKDKAPAESAPVTVGVDKSKLINAIDDANNALDPDKGGRNDGTPADKALQDAIDAGKKVIENPNATQDDVDKATKAIEDAIKEKEETDKALDELKKAKEELDKTIEDAEADEKPDEAIDNGRDASDDADTVINNNGKDADGKDMTSEQIKELVEKTKEENRLLRLPVIQVRIDTAINNGRSIIFTTNPGRCNVTITILRSDNTKETYDATTGPEGTGSITLDKSLKTGESVMVRATRITEDRPVPDYLDNYTSTGV